MDERELVRLAAGGDSAAFEQLVLSTQKMVYNLCLRMSGSGEDARDLSQEAYLRAWRALGGFNQESGFSTWLYRLTSNICIDFLRRQKRQGVVSLQMEDGELEIADERAQPEHLAERGELRAAVREAMDALPGEYRQVLTLREIGGLSYSEIAESMGIAEGTVKSKLWRARERLRRKLCESGNFSVPDSSEKVKAR